MLTRGCLGSTYSGGVAVSIQRKQGEVNCNRCPLGAWANPIASSAGSMTFHPDWITWLNLYNHCRPLDVDCPGENMTLGLQELTAAQIVPEGAGELTAEGKASIAAPGLERNKS